MIDETFTDNIKEAIHQADLLLRPSALFINMHDEEEILKAIPDIEEKVALVKTNYVERGKAYLMDRKILENPIEMNPASVCSSFSVYCSTCMNRYNCAESEYHQNGGCNHFRSWFSSPMPSATAYLKGMEKAESTNDDLISRAAVLEAIEKSQPCCDAWKRIIDNTPSVAYPFEKFRTMLCGTCQAHMKIEPERPQGIWTFDEKGYFYCNKCGKYPRDQYATTDFCPLCGADMRKGGAE